MVDDLTPKFQKEFQKRYRQVLEYAKNSKLDSFINKIHQYYNYIWQNNKGIDENQILKSLPNSIKYDIFMIRYNNVIQSSRFFKDDKNQLDQNIFYSFCKKFKYQIFMPDDIILTAGQEDNTVYLILEGEVEIQDITTGTVPKLESGQYFGGIVPNIPQLYTVKAL